MTTETVQESANARVSVSVDKAHHAMLRKMSKDNDVKVYELANALIDLANSDNLVRERVVKMAKEAEEETKARLSLTSLPKALKEKLASLTPEQIANLMLSV